MTSVSLPGSSAAQPNGLRPINLKTDLAALADLIELSFADSMDSSGRAAVREMRAISRSSVGTGLLVGLNEITQGLSLGFVWIEDGQLVGNVSIYPANWPTSLGSTWIIANVAVRPEFQRRGIARQLMEASLALIGKRGGVRAILQVDADNETAINLYQRLGFVQEREWTRWRRTSRMSTLQPMTPRVHISRRRRDEWRAEYALANMVRPQALGGMGWQRPLHPSHFRNSVGKLFSDFFNLRSVERLVIRSGDEKSLHAVMWVENAFGASSTQLTLMVEPAYQGMYDELLIHTAVQRFGIGRSGLVIEHPSAETQTSEVLTRFGFQTQRKVIHMHWDARI